MRENRTSGSEGGAAEPNRSSLPLSCSENRPQESLTALPTTAHDPESQKEAKLEIARLLQQKGAKTAN